MSTNNAFYYRLYDIPVMSEIELPELEQIAAHSDGEESAPLLISMGNAPEALPDGVKSEDGWYEVNATELICSVPEIGRFHVTNGQSIVIDPDPSAARNDVRTYLFGVAFAAVVHQRKLLPLHISAIRTPYGVWAFTGDSGAGKSTLVGLLNKLTGWPLLCDDVAVIRIGDDGKAMISAGLLRLKLWDDAVELLGADRDKLVRDLERENKFHLKDPVMFNTQTLPLKALVRLERGAEISIAEISGAQLFETVMNGIYRPYFVPIFGDSNLNITTCAKVAAAIDGFVFQRPWSSKDQQKIAEHLIDYIRNSD